MFTQVFTLKKLKIITKVQIALFSLRNVSFRQKVMLIFSIKLIEKKFLTHWILCQHTGDGKNWLFLATSNSIYELGADQSLDLKLNNFCLLKSSGGWRGDSQHAQLAAVLRSPRQVTSCSFFSSSQLSYIPTRQQQYNKS